MTSIGLAKEDNVSFIDLFSIDKEYFVEYYPIPFSKTVSCNLLYFRDKSSFVLPLQVMARFLK
jgi:hypothetical protein